jgi:HTH-type transcriptional regulator/antitoxin HigA
MSPIRPIESDADLSAALQRVDELWPKKDKSDKVANELKVLSVLIEDYERRAHPVAAPTPIEAIVYRMDQMEMNTTSLGEAMGTTRSRASEVLNGVRSLTLPMIEKLMGKPMLMDANVLVGSRVKTEIPLGRVSDSAVSSKSSRGYRAKRRETSSASKSAKTPDRVRAQRGSKSTQKKGR